MAETPRKSGTEAGALPQIGLREVALDDKYDLEKREVFLTGTQAVARMLLMQRERDRQAGLDTAGFVSGYRGSPLGGLDQQLMRAAKPLRAANIVFQPGLNEDLAATAIWGTQQAGSAAKASMMVSSRSGTARGPASTAPATSSATATWLAPIRRAA